MLTAAYNARRHVIPCLHYGGHVYRVGIMSKLKCVIHYKHLGATNEIITAVNEDTFKKLQENKEARRTLGGEYIHKEQIDNLPSSLDSETHGFHRQCYQKFTNAVSVLKRKKTSKDVPDKRQRRSTCSYLISRLLHEMQVF